LAAWREVILNSYKVYYERVMLLLKRGVVVDEISSMIGRGKRVVLEYIQIAREYHPELFADVTCVA
jgi:hypothetical protein